MLSLNNDLLVFTNNNGRAEVNLKDEPVHTKNIIKKEIADAAKKDAQIATLHAKVVALTKQIQDSLE